MTQTLCDGLVSPWPHMGLDGFNERFVSHQQYMCPQAPMGEWWISIVLIIFVYIYVIRHQWVKWLVCIIPTIYALSGLNGLSDGWCHPDHICVTRPQWVKWRVGIIPTICVIRHQWLKWLVGIIPTIYVTSGLNRLIDGLVLSHICVIRPQWVNWGAGIIRAIDASPGLNGLSVGLVPPRLCMRH